MICRVYLEIQGKEDLLENLYVTLFLHYIFLLTQFPTVHLTSEVHLGAFPLLFFPAEL